MTKTLALAGSLVIATLCAARPASAQQPITLAEAIARAMAHNLDAGSAEAAEREAAERVRLARGGYFPKVDVAESWQRGDQPVFVFGALLGQRQFTADGFALATLNHPAATDNFRTALTVEQPLFDRTTTANLRAAVVGRTAAATGRRLVDHELAAAVTEAFGRVLVDSAMVRSAAAAVESAQADRERASHRRDAGRGTDADVLQLEVYLARAREQQVQATSDERVARARLNQLMGEPLTARFSLDPVSPAVDVDLGDPVALQAEAVRNRPEVALAHQREQLAAVAVDGARAAFLPQVTAQAGVEFNGSRWQTRASGWLVGAAARVNVFHGFADQARLAEARARSARRAIETGKAETMVRLDVEIAVARLEAARASDVVGRTAADSARASRRIIRDRYESGLADTAMLLRAADAVQQAEAQQIAAFVHVLTATATLQRAIGRP